VLVGLTNQHTTPLQKPPSPNSDSNLHGSPDLNSNSANLLSSLSSFPLLRQISPKPRSQPGGFSYGQGVRANPNASLLFNYYVSQTAHQICAAPVHNNPFLNIVLPIAFSDHVVMNSVLAIAGAHLRFDETLNQETVTATWSHHSLVLRDLQLELSRSQLDQENEKLRMLLIILLLCMVEVGFVYSFSSPIIYHQLHFILYLVVYIRKFSRHIHAPLKCRSRTRPIHYIQASGNRDHQTSRPLEFPARNVFLHGLGRNHNSPGHIRNPEPKPE